MEEIKKPTLHNQAICSDCLQSLVNDERERDEKELDNMAETLISWAEQGYFPFGPSDNPEPYFSQRNCDLCGQKPGSRYDYSFYVDQLIWDQYEQTH